MSATFGLDFGTTNSLLTVIGRDAETGRAVPLVLAREGRPHPSVVWYSNQGTIVGRRAKEQLSELGLGVFGDIVRSPKMYLGYPTGIDVGGVTRQPVDVVADVLRFLREDAVARDFKGNDFRRAVITIPVSMRGTARAELREAATKAGIRVHQFVHEPLAAFYGYMRARPELARRFAGLERRLVLVFDWGGGTLDVTLCCVQQGVLFQVCSVGEARVGGDQFDLRVQRLVKHKHEAGYPDADWSRLQPGAEARLIQACEDAKIALSARTSTAVFVRDVLAVPGAAKDIRVELTRRELEEAVQDLVKRGLGTIQTILDKAGVSRIDVEYCVATGGMVSMPAITEGLREFFGMSRLRIVENAASIISEGAAWIAHDDVTLQLAKPIEVLHADNCYVELVPARTKLPAEGQSVSHTISMYCVDPTDGFAKFLFARPAWPDAGTQTGERIPYGAVVLPVDQYSEPLFERLALDITIDQDLIVCVEARSTLRGEKREAKIMDLEFGIDMSCVVTAAQSESRGESRVEAGSGDR